MTTAARGGDIKRRVRAEVHARAAAAGWANLGRERRRELYERWSEDPAVGGLLSEVMQPHQVRVYLKDTVLKKYARGARPGLPALLQGMGVRWDEVTRWYTTPAAMLCDGKALYTLALAKDWKIAVMNAFERRCDAGPLERNLVLLTDHTAGRLVDRDYRGIIEAAGRRLDVDVHWVT